MDDESTWSINLRLLQSPSNFTTSLEAEQTERTEGDNDRDKDEASNSQTNLLLLPAELRINIYRHMFQAYGNLSRHVRRREASSGPRCKRRNGVSLPIDSLMFTCRQLYAEISGLVPRLAILHIHKQIQLGSKYCSVNLVQRKDTPFWHVPARLRTAQTVIGRWDFQWPNFFASTYPGAMPTIPFDLVQRNDFHWKRLVMRLDLCLNQLYSNAHRWYSLMQSFDMRRIVGAFVHPKLHYFSIDDFMNFGEENGLHVSVVVNIRIHQSRNSEILCKVVIHGGTIAIAERHPNFPAEDELLRVFRLYFFEGWKSAELRQMIAQS